MTRGTYALKVLGFFLLLGGVLTLNPADHINAAYTLKDNYTDTTSLFDWNFRNTTSANYYIGEKFVPDYAFSITRASFYFKKVGSPTGNVWAELYDCTSASSPSLLQTSSTVASSSISTSYAWTDFNFTGYNLNISTLYCVILTSDSSVDGSNYFVTGVKNTDSYGISGEDTERKTGTGSWAELTTFDTLFKTFETTPDATPTPSPSPSPTPSPTITPIPIVNRTDFSTASATAIADTIHVNYYFYALILISAGIITGLHIFQR